MKRIASILALVVGIAGATAGTASAQDTSQVAVIEQSAAAASFAKAWQEATGESTNLNVSIAVALNLAEINQMLGPPEDDEEEGP